MYSIIIMIVKGELCHFVILEVCIKQVALNHRSSLKGLNNRVVMDDPPLTIAPRGQEITPLISKEEI